MPVDVVYVLTGTIRHMKELNSFIVFESSTFESESPGLESKSQTFESESTSEPGKM